MLCLVSYKTITYIKLPMAEAYNNFLISTLLLLPPRALLNIHLAVCRQWEPTDFASDMLNLSRTFVTYFSCDTHNTFLVLSRTIYIPKIYLANPRSFMESDLPNAFFKLTILFVSCPSINMSSTYNKRIKKSPSSYLLTNTQWSARVLWNSCSSMKDLNCLYHWCGACFKPYKLFFSRHTRLSFPLSSKPSCYCM